MRSPICGLHDLHHGADERARRVVLAAVAPGVAHVLDLGFVEVRELVLLGLRAEAQLVDVVDDLAQVVAALDLVLDLAEDLADLVFDGVRPAGLLLEAVQVGEELPVDEVAQVVAGQRLVVVELAVLALRRGPALPAVGLVEDEGVLLALQRGLRRLVLLQPVEVLQEQQPGGLLGVVELGGAAGLFPEDVVDVLEGLFEHAWGSVVAGFRGAGMVSPAPVWDDTLAAICRPWRPVFRCMVRVRNPFRMTMRVLSVIPPMTQLNMPYPLTAYLTGFLRSRGIEAMQEDLALALVLRLFSAAGLRRLADGIEAQPKKKRGARASSSLSAFDDYVGNDRARHRLSCRGAIRAWRIASPAVPSCPRGRASRRSTSTSIPTAAIRWPGPSARSARRTARAIWPRSTSTTSPTCCARPSDPRFEFVRYARVAGASPGQFRPAGRGPGRTANLVDRTLHDLTAEAIAPPQAATGPDLGALPRRGLRRLPHRPGRSSRIAPEIRHRPRRRLRQHRAARTHRAARIRLFRFRLPR